MKEPVGEPPTAGSDTSCVLGLHTQGLRVVESPEGFNGTGLELEHLNNC